MSRSLLQKLYQQKGHCTVAGKGGSIVWVMFASCVSGRKRASEDSEGIRRSQVKRFSRFFRKGELSIWRIVRLAGDCSCCLAETERNRKRKEKEKTEEKQAQSSALSSQSSASFRLSSHSRGVLSPALDSKKREEKRKKT